MMAMPPVRGRPFPGPAALKKDTKAAKTVGELCDLYIKEAEQGNVIGKRGAPKKASTLVADRGHIERHIKPLLAKKACPRRDARRCRALLA